VVVVVVLLQPARDASNPSKTALTRTVLKMDLVMFLSFIVPPLVMFLCNKKAPHKGGAQKHKFLIVLSFPNTGGVTISSNAL
jgi:hypothetical protein